MAIFRKLAQRVVVSTINRVPFVKREASNQAREGNRNFLARGHIRAAGDRGRAKKLFGM